MVFFITIGPALYAQGTEISLDVADDATLYESSQGDIANGKGQYIFIGMTNNGDLRRSLIRFDLGTEIPSNATIDSVLFLINMNKTRNTAQELLAYPVLGHGQRAAQMHPPMRVKVPRQLRVILPGRIAYILTHSGIMMGETLVRKSYSKELSRVAVPIR